MEIIKEDGKIITKMSFSECFFGYDDPNLSKEIINIFDENLSYSYQPERLSEGEHFEETFDDYLKNPGKYFRRMEDNLIKEMLCDSPNTPTKGSESSRND